jgi:FtsP/CotA-like multicopper oxidase with cupredoxin domain
MPSIFLPRRSFVRGLAATGATAALGGYAQEAEAAASGFGHPELGGSTFDLAIGEAIVNVTGSRAAATLVNEMLPGPVLRWRQGDALTLRVRNALRVPTSIHWHGVRVPASMDGVPALSFMGVQPGETFTYRFTLPEHQTGTYWYHSHSGFQEQTGLYGAIVIEPRGSYRDRFDRDYVVVLSDWSDTDPEQEVAHRALVVVVVVALELQVADDPPPTPAAMASARPSATASNGAGCA